MEGKDTETWSAKAYFTLAVHLFSCHYTHNILISIFLPAVNAKFPSTTVLQYL